MLASRRALAEWRYELAAELWYRKSYYYRRRLLRGGHGGDGLTAELGGYSVRAMVERGLIFVHVPKCAGTFVNRQLFGCLGGGHLRAVDYRRMLGPAAYRRLETLTVLRNPWDRLYSAYRHLRGAAVRAEPVRNVRLARLLEGPFEGFVRGLDQGLVFSSELVLRPQYLFVAERFAGSHCLIDHLFVHERIEELCERYGFSPEQDRVNASGGGFQRADVYSHSTRRRVAELYREDLDLAGFRFA